MRFRGSTGLWQIRHVNPKYARKGERKVLPFPSSQSIFLNMEEHNADGRKSLPSPHEAIRVLREGPVGWLVLDRPQRRNALTLSMWRALPQAVATLVAEQDLRVIIMRGAGGHFSSGADISEFAELFSGPAAEEYERANLDGLAYPLHGIMRLLQAVSAASARELLLTGRRMDAAWALRTGLVNDVRPPGQLEAETLAVARDIAANAPLSIAHARAAIDAMTTTLHKSDAERLRNLARTCFDTRITPKASAPSVNAARPASGDDSPLLPKTPAQRKRLPAIATGRTRGEDRCMRRPHLTECRKQVSIPDIFGSPHT